MELLSLLGQASSSLRLAGVRITPDGVVLILERTADHARQRPEDAADRRLVGGGVERLQRP